MRRYVAHRQMLPFIAVSMSASVGFGFLASKAEADIKRVDTKLANEKFVANAPEEVVEEEKEKREAAVERKTKILEAMERLKSVAS